MDGWETGVSTQFAALAVAAPPPPLLIVSQPAANMLVPGKSCMKIHQMVINFVAELPSQSLCKIKRQVVKR